LHVDVLGNVEHKGILDTFLHNETLKGPSGTVPSSQSKKKKKKVSFRSAQSVAETRQYMEMLQKVHASVMARLAEELQKEQAIAQQLQEKRKSDAMEHEHAVTTNLEAVQNVIRHQEQLRDQVKTPRSHSIPCINV
jgi:hypothetical protein